MPQRDLIAAMIQDLEQVEDNVLLFRAGRASAYQTVAIQLRNLLLKGRRSLIDRVLPDATFHQLAPVVPVPSRPEAKVMFEFRSRGRLVISTGAPARLDLEFSNDLPLVGLDEWLRQWVITPSITIEKLIRDAADEEVAHTQDEIGKTIETASLLKTTSRFGEQSMHQLAVVALGDYAAARIRVLLESSRPGADTMR